MGNGITRNGRADSMPMGLGIGAAVSLSITVLVSVLISKLIDKETIAWNSVGYCIMVQTMLSSFLGAVIAAGRVKRQRLMVCFASGIVYYCLLIGIAMLFFGGQLEGMGVTALLILAGCGCAALLGVQEKRAGWSRKGKKRYR